MQVIPVFAGGLDFSIPVKRFFYEPMYRQRAFVDTVVSLTGFALVGGPARQDAPKAVTALKALNVPYLVSLPLVFQTTEEWMESDLGVHPVQVALQVSALSLLLSSIDFGAGCKHPASLLDAAAFIMHHKPSQDHDPQHISARLIKHTCLSCLACLVMHFNKFHPVYLI